MFLAFVNFWEKKFPRMVGFLRVKLQEFSNRFLAFKDRKFSEMFEFLQGIKYVQYMKYVVYALMGIGFISGVFYGFMFARFIDMIDSDIYSVSYKRDFRRSVLGFPYPLMVFFRLLHNLNCDLSTFLTYTQYLVFVLMALSTVIGVGAFKHLVDFEATGEVKHLVRYFVKCVALAIVTITLLYLGPGILLKLLFIELQYFDRAVIFGVFEVFRFWGPEDFLRWAEWYNTIIGNKRPCPYIEYLITISFGSMQRFQKLYKAGAFKGFSYKSKTTSFNDFVSVVWAIAGLNRLFFGNYAGPFARENLYLFSFITMLRMLFQFVPGSEPDFGDDAYNEIFQDDEVKNADYYEEYFRTHNDPKGEEVFRAHQAEREHKGRGNW
jgi:uncharacterized membrane protein